MLYKKYHRNFVRQFKKGTEFKCINGCRGRFTVKRSPYYDETCWSIRMSSSEYEYDVWILVYSRGQLAKDIVHVIQEIS